MIINGNKEIEVMEPIADRFGLIRQAAIDVKRD